MGGGGGASGMLQLLQRAAAHVRRPPLVHAGAATISYPQKNKQGRIAVQQWTGTDWRYLRQVPPPGTPDDTEGTTWNGMALAGASGGLLYLMHNSNLDSSRVTVLQYNGYDWSARECVWGGGGWGRVPGERVRIGRAAGSAAVHPPRAPACRAVGGGPITSAGATLLTMVIDPTTLYPIVAYDVSCQGRVVPARAGWGPRLVLMRAAPAPLTPLPRPDAPRAGKRFKQCCHGQTLDWLCLGGTGQQECDRWAGGELRRPPVPRCLALGRACGRNQGKLLAPLWACMWTRPAGAASASNEARARRAPHPDTKHAFLRAQASDGTNKLVVVRWDGSAWQVGVCG